MAGVAFTSTLDKLLPLQHQQEGRKIWQTDMVDPGGGAAYDEGEKRASPRLRLPGRRRNSCQ